ncbi:MAG: DUF1385 domain-containing protein, partial [Fervidobacterium sp.]
DGKIDVVELGTANRNSKWFKIPFFRGFMSLFYSLYFGIKAINLSAEISTDEKMKKSESVFSVLSSILLAIGLFIILPAFLTKWLGFKDNEFIFSVVDGFLRLGIFLLYVYTISLFEDVKNVFRYHGAEHKVVHTFENEEELTVENARKYSTIHPRCGTNFVMIFLIIAILIHSLFGLFGPISMIQRILLRLLALPIVAGISYELLRLFDKYPSLRLLATPGFILQKLTTAEPNDSQLEVAIVSLRYALELVDDSVIIRDSRDLPESISNVANLYNEENKKSEEKEDESEFLG